MRDLGKYEALERALRAQKAADEAVKAAAEAVNSAKSRLDEANKIAWEAAKAVSNIVEELLRESGESGQDD